MFLGLIYRHCTFILYLNAFFKFMLASSTALKLENIACLQNAHKRIRILSATTTAKYEISSFYQLSFSTNTVIFEVRS